MSKARQTVETLRTVLVDGDVTNANFTGADLEVGKGGTGASSAGAARTALGLAIGTDVQAYDANTAKLDEAANFTGTLQNGGSNVIVDSDIGTTVLAPNGSAANLTNLPAGGNVVDFVASGTLPNGKPVILNSNGTVTVVGETTIAADIPYGSETTFGTNRGQYTSPAAFDPNTAGKFVVAFVDRDNTTSNSRYAAAIVGTVSGSSISFGTPVVFNAGSTYFTNVAFDPNNANKIVVCFRNNTNSDSGTARVGTISGTSISFGTAVVFNSGATNYMNIAFDPNTSNKLVITYSDAANSNYGTAILGTISGTSISFGSESVFYAEASVMVGVAFDPNTANKFVVAHRDSSWHGHVKIGTVSGTSISFGAVNTFHSDTTIVGEIAFDPNTANKFIVVYQNDGASTKDGTAIVGTISGTSISYGTPVVYRSSESNYNSISFDPNTANSFVVAYYQNSGLLGRANIGTISGTSLSFSSPYTFNPSLTSPIAVRFDPNAAGQLVFTYVDGGLAYALTGVTTHQGTNLTSTNFLGFATAAYTNGQTASIMLKGGISDNQTSLTAGSTYYVRGDATLATSAGNPSVLAGEAVSATSLLLNGLDTPAAPDEIPSQSGNTGKFLTTDGSAASWGTVAPAGLIHISTVSASGASAVTVSGMNSTYDRYIIKGDNLHFSSNNINFRARFNGSTSSTGGVRFGLALGLTTFYKAEGGDFELIDTVSNDADNNTSFSFETGSANDYGHQHGTAITTTSVDSSGDAGVRTVVSGGSLTGINTTLTSMQFVVNSGTITGKFRLYGVSKAND